VTHPTIIRRLEEMAKTQVLMLRARRRIRGIIGRSVTMCHPLVSLKLISAKSAVFMWSFTGDGFAANSDSLHHPAGSAQNASIITNARI